jgi:SAM-dependent methyltransferase
LSPGDPVPREPFRPRLGGEVLEVGPGTTPFPTAPGASVCFADRPIPGGRDASFPELVGEPHGPEADYEIDLDADGLAPIADGRLDAVVLSHVIEHLANPIRALEECERVLRASGRLVLIVPLRHTTFDSLRPGTTLSHLLEEHEAGVTEVDVDHIREFCRSVYGQEPPWPTEPRERHNPDRLDEALIAMHRRRSIHAHCWDAEEMASLLTALIAREVVGFELVDLFFGDDPGAADIEFGFLLQRGARGIDAAEAFIDAWVGMVLRDASRDPSKVGVLTAALARDVPAALDDPDAAALVARPSLTAARLLRDAQGDHVALDAERAEATRRADDLAAQLAARDAELAGVLASRTHRAGLAVTAPLRLARRFIR